MTIVKQLYSLQELDLALDLIRSQKAVAEKELTARLALEKIERSLEEDRRRLEEIQSSHRMQQIEAEVLRQRSSALDGQLYSGEVANPRDLPSLQLEASNVKAQVDQKEILLLELSVRAEDTRHRIADLGKELAEVQEAWKLRQAYLNEQVASLTAEEQELSAQRSQLAQTLDQSEVHKYDALRRSKGGTAVARVERGLCQSCRMSLPSQHLQRARAGRQTVNCSSCGRMLLFLG
ncbi:MAG TPA: C4-type zinc ribbon domain-containing protein [Dehalococcoidia bacterium]|nr:C4-type zinc ribbon domain-containing protein [Dehalococcoidia bacterium]